MARPRKAPDAHVPTDENREIVRTLYAAGIPLDRIANRLCISHPTLSHHYKPELDHCLDNMIGALANNLYQDAINGDKKDREFWLKTRGRFAYHKPPEEVIRDNLNTSLLEDIKASLVKQEK